jgi:hypothetical protein
MNVGPTIAMPVRTAAATLGVDLSPLPEPLTMPDLVDACLAAGVVPSDVLELVAV